MLPTYDRTVGTDVKEDLATTLTVLVNSTGVPKGRTLIVDLGWNGSGTVAPTCVDTKGNVYTLDNANNTNQGNNIRMATFSSRISIPLVSGDVITGTIPAASVARAMVVEQYNG